MTGTSLDGLDAALVRVHRNGLEMTTEFVGLMSIEFDAPLRETLVHLASGKAAKPLVYMQAARALGQMHADAVEQLLAEHPADTPDFVVAHGQTICHAPGSAGIPGNSGTPKNGGTSGKREALSGVNDVPVPGMSWQLFDPWPMVHQLGVPVCYDLRQADLIAGGQGAPITPIADWVMYRDRAQWVINLGGICNGTYLHSRADQIKGADFWPCNLLLDGLCSRLFDQPFDIDGQMAAQGEVLPALLRILAHEVDTTIGSAPNPSLGREQFSPDWLNALLEKMRAHGGPHDILRTAAHMVALAIRRRVDRPGEQPVAIAGGGVKNLTLVSEIRELVIRPAITSDELGIPCQAREAMAFAVLGALSQDGVPITLPQVTGAQAPGVAGVWARP